MAEQARQTEQPNRAQQIRERSAEQEQEVMAALREAEIADTDHLLKFMDALVRTLFYAAGSLSIIAAELAEANSRDREAEVRAKSAEAFVAELAKAQSLVVPATVHVPRPKR